MKWKNTEIILIILDMIIMKQLLVYLYQYKEQTKTEHKDLMLALAEVAKLPCKQNAQGKPHKGKY